MWQWRIVWPAGSPSFTPMLNAFTVESRRMIAARVCRSSWSHAFNSQVKIIGLMPFWNDQCVKRRNCEIIPQGVSQAALRNLTGVCGCAKDTILVTCSIQLWDWRGSIWSTSKKQSSVDIPHNMQRNPAAFSTS